jgi:hypothetical protein
MVAPPPPPPPGLDHPDDHFPPPGLDHPNEVKMAIREAKRKAFYVRMTAMEAEALILQEEADAAQAAATAMKTHATLLRVEWGYRTRNER